MKQVYSMSEVGSCPRIIGARRLGYDPLPRTASDEKQLKHYSRMEQVAAEQIMEYTGLAMEVGVTCRQCRDKYGLKREGIHVEIDTPLFLLVGHLDRRLILMNGQKMPVEIKSLGKASWGKFAKTQFEEFPEYAGQECCYLEAEKSPGVYWVMERDSGASLRYTVQDNPYGLEGFTNISLPVTFDQILDKINMVELSAQEGKLMDGIESGMCWFCQYKFLCLKEKEKDDTKQLDLPHLADAAETYKAALELEKEAKELKSDATLILLNHAKQNQIDKYRVGGLSMTYRGQKTRDTLDGSKLKQESPELYRLCLRQSKPFDDYSIKLLGQSKKEDK